MDLSVIVCTYNRAASLELTLRAFAAQTTPPELTWELVVVDNNSTDATRSVVEAFAATAAVRVRYLFEGRQGLSHARNAGITGSIGALMAFTDDDVRPDPDWVAGVAPLMRESGADILGGRILPLWERTPPPWLAARPHLRGPFTIMDHPWADRVVEARGIPNVWGANMAFRREVFSRVGFFHPDLGLTGRKLYRGEEIELVRRALAAGCRVIYDPRLVVWHRIPAARMRRRFISRLYFEQAEGEGLSQAPAPGRRLLGAPRYLYRQVASRTSGWLWAAVRGRPDALDRWLASCELAGTLWGRWKRYFRSARGRV
ncbi:MAG TPA: glycosyltransferase [Verrucomicrobiae bacterium]|jgi:GT2 family glycosyltransferase|nr:glycosyltransferase [Verrucomicrobiae bacterium]